MMGKRKKKDIKKDKKGHENRKTCILKIGNE